MIEKSLYENYQIDFSADIKPTTDDYIFIFNNERELYLTDDMNLPKSLDAFKVDFCLFIGKYHEKNSFVVNVDSDESFHDLREVYEFDHDLYHIAGKAVLVRDWYITPNQTVIKPLFVHQNAHNPVLTK